MKINWNQLKVNWNPFLSWLTKKNVEGGQKKVRVIEYPQIGWGGGPPHTNQRHTLLIYDDKYCVNHYQSHIPQCPTRIYHPSNIIEQLKDIQEVMGPSRAPCPLDAWSPCIKFYWSILAHMEPSCILAALPFFLSNGTGRDKGRQSSTCQPPSTAMSFNWFQLHVAKQSNFGQQRGYPWISLERTEWHAGARKENVGTIRNQSSRPSKDISKPARISSNMNRSLLFLDDDASRLCYFGWRVWRAWYYQYDTGSLGQDMAKQIPSTKTLIKRFPKRKPICPKRF